jgi:hypothetical protein
MWFVVVIVIEAVLAWIAHFASRLFFRKHASAK